MFYWINLNCQDFFLSSSRGRFSAIGMNFFELFLFTGVVWPILFFRILPVFVMENTVDLYKRKPLGASKNFIFASMVTIIILSLSGGVRVEIARNGTLIMLLIIISLLLYYRFQRKEFTLLAVVGLAFFVLVCLLMEVSFGFAVF